MLDKCKAYFIEASRMLTVKTHLAPSKIHGIGLFASEEIPAKSILWKYNRFVDKIISKQAFLKICSDLDFNALQHFLNSTYKKNNKYFYLTDNARFINHSLESYNISFFDDFTEITLCDIHEGDELLENYFHVYDEDDFFFQELYNKNPYDYLKIITQGFRTNVHHQHIS